MGCQGHPGPCAKPTPGALFTQQMLQNRFSLYYGGMDNQCRGGTGYSGYSQHSWGNAIDLTPRPKTTAAKTLEQLDPVAGFLLKNRYAFGIHGLLWRGKSLISGYAVAGHFDHIHVSFFPYGKDTPNCAAPWQNANRWQYSSKLSSKSEWQLYPSQGEYDGAQIQDTDTLPLTAGDVGPLVKHYQGQMIKWDPYALPVYRDDGTFGAEMSEWVWIFKGRFGISQDHVLDQALADALDATVPVLAPVEPQPPVIPPPVQPPVIIHPPPVVIEAPPLPEYTAGYEGLYRRFFYPLKGKVGERAERENQSALEDYLNKETDYTQAQIDDIVKYLNLISGDENKAAVAQTGLASSLRLASGTGVDHRSLVFVEPDQHHARYTDAEAIAAVGGSGGGGMDQSLFLKLDASNDPVTGRLHVDAEMYSHEFVETAAVGGTVHNHDSKYLTKLEAAGFADHVIASVPPPNPKVGEVWIDPLAIPPGQRQFFIQDAEPIGVDIGDVWVAPNA